MIKAVKPAYNVTRDFTYPPINASKPTLFAKKSIRPTEIA
jgi:hypothetical protein